MPNPFMRGKPMNTSHGNTAVYPDSITEHPQPTPPVEERYAGDNNPYRGTEQHGVESDDRPHPTEGYATRAVAVRMDPPPPNVEPIPVRIVEEGGREIRSMRTVVMMAPGSASFNAALILGRDDTRTFTRLKNPHETETIYINHQGHTVAQAAMNGFPIGPGEHYETQTQEEVYASATGAADLPVPMIIEFSLPIGRPVNATFG